jgi:hypothetical protein
MKAPNYIYFCVGFFVMLSGILKAQPNLQDTFDYNFSAFCLKPIDKEHLFFKDASGEMLPIQFKTKTRSIRYDVKIFDNEPNLAFYRKTISARGDPEFSFAGSTTVSRSAKSPLIVISNNRGQMKNQFPREAEFSIFEVNEDLIYFPINSIRLLNVTTIELFVDVNGSRFSLKEGDTSQPVAKINSPRSEIMIAAQGSERTHLLYKNSIFIPEGSRGLLIIRPPSRANSFRLSERLLLDMPQRN